MSKISPIIILTIEILAILFFVFGLLQLVIRCFLKRPSFSSVPQSNRSLFPNDASNSGSPTLQRQLQELFYLHDSGLDRDTIDALPTFNYKEIMGLKKEPFDCAVCLCEFSDGDKLKLLVNCSHAFHIHCIDTWLLSNSTCPLCRGLIGVGPLFGFDDKMEERVNASFRSRGPEVSGERVFSVRLGKFRSTNEGFGSGQDNENPSVGCSSGNSSRSRSRCLDARRCHSMGAFRYIVAEADLQVSLSQNEEIDGKNINLRSRGDSFSVSKIWLWSKKGKLSTSLDANDHVIGNSNPERVMANQC